MRFAAGTRILASESHPAGVRVVEGGRDDEAESGRGDEGDPAVKTIRSEITAASAGTNSRGSQADPARPRIYDPYSLATRPMPTELRLFPHPKGISPALALYITGGAVN